jgi:hypothetical protein
MRSWKMMTKGEEELRALLLAKGFFPDDIDPFIANLKEGDYFIHGREVLKVTWDNIMGCQEDGVFYSIKAENFPEELENDFEVGV